MWWPFFQPRKRKFSEGSIVRVLKTVKIHSVCSQVQMKLAVCCFAGLVQQKCTVYVCAHKCMS